MAHPTQPATLSKVAHARLSFNADAAAIAIALSLAALIRCNIIHRIGW